MLSRLVCTLTVLLLGLALITRPAKSRPDTDTQQDICKHHAGSVYRTSSSAHRRHRRAASAGDHPLTEPACAMGSREVSRSRAGERGLTGSREYRIVSNVIRFGRESLHLAHTRWESYPWVAGRVTAQGQR